MMSCPIINYKWFLFLFGLVVIGTTAHVWADEKFYTKNVQLVRGGIEGEICNKTFEFWPEIVMKATAVRRNGEEIWREYTSVSGLGPYQCRSFFETRGHIEKGFDVKFQYYPGKTGHVLSENDDDGTFLFKNFKVVDRELTGNVCNRSNFKIKDLKVNVFAVDNRKNVRWTTYFFIDEISAGKCEEVSRHVLGDEIHRLFGFLFSMEKVFQNENIYSGQITEGLSFKDINVKYKYLTGKICNDSEKQKNDVFIRFYNMRGLRWVFWDELVAIPHLESGECREVSEPISSKNEPSHWKFTVFEK